MKKTGLILRHEFLVTIRRKAFIIMTLAFPVLALLLMLIVNIVSNVSSPEKIEFTEIGYVDHTGIFTDNTTQGRITFTSYASVEAANDALIQKEISEYYFIPANYLETGLIQRFTTNRELEPRGESIAATRSFLIGNLLKGSEPEIIFRAQAPMNLMNTLLTGSGEIAPNQGGFATFIVPYIFSILLVMSIFYSAGYLLQGLGEEKEGRVMEILLSSVSPRQLIAGKIIGLGAAGLLQILVWLVSAVVIANFVSTMFGDVIGELQVSAPFIILGLTYFMLGYLFFAVVMAGVGSITPTAREGQQMATIFTMVGVIPLFLMAFLIENPNSVIATVLTLIPPTAPITVMIRLGLTEIPFWELATSIGLSILTIYGCYILASKLFRTYLLMYGKSPGVRQLLQNFRKA